jgi:ribosomal protein S18 acetylase RimI-like enzyme
MLIQHHQPIPLARSTAPPPPPTPPEYSYNSHISSPAAVHWSPRESQTKLPGLAQSRDSSFTIRRATVEDASAIAKLGGTVFATTFGFSIPPNDLQAFLDDAYTTEAIEEDIRSPRIHIFVACSKPNNDRPSLSLSSSQSSEVFSAASNSSDGDDASTTEGEIVGFAQLTEGTTEPCLSHITGAVELQRLYVSTQHHGQGIGQRLAREIESLARTLAYKALWLGVWEGNFKAQRVYEALGYSKIGDHEFKMGKCIQMDWIMCKDL